MKIQDMLLKCKVCSYQGRCTKPCRKVEDAIRKYIKKEDVK